METYQHSYLHNYQHNYPHNYQYNHQYNYQHNYPHNYQLQAAEYQQQQQQNDHQSALAYSQQQPSSNDLQYNDNYNQQQHQLLHNDAHVNYHQNTNDNDGINHHHYQVATTQQQQQPIGDSCPTSSDQLLELYSSHNIVDNNHQYCICNCNYTNLFDQANDDSMTAASNYQCHTHRQNSNFTATTTTAAKNDGTVEQQYVVPSSSSSYSSATPISSHHSAPYSSTYIALHNGDYNNNNNNNMSNIASSENLYEHSNYLTPIIGTTSVNEVQFNQSGDNISNYSGNNQHYNPAQSRNNQQQQQQQYTDDRHDCQHLDLDHHHQVNSSTREIYNNKSTSLYIDYSAAEQQFSPTYQQHADNAAMLMVSAQPCHAVAPSLPVSDQRQLQQQQHHRCSDIIASEPQRAYHNKHDGKCLTKVAVGGAYDAYHRQYQYQQHYDGNTNYDYNNNYNTNYPNKCSSNNQLGAPNLNNDSRQHDNDNSLSNDDDNGGRLFAADDTTTTTTTYHHHHRHNTDIKSLVTLRLEHRTMSISTTSEEISERLLGKKSTSVSKLWSGAMRTATSRLKGLTNINNDNNSNIVVTNTSGKRSDISSNNSSSGDSTINNYRINYNKSDRAVKSKLSCLSPQSITVAGASAKLTTNNYLETTTMISLSDPDNNSRCFKLIAANSDAINNNHQLIVPSNDPSTNGAKSCIKSAATTTTTTSMQQQYNKQMSTAIEHYKGETGNQSIMAYHLQTTSRNLKANQCDICGRDYARPSTLKTHLRTHTNERPFRCQICSKTFSQAANLTAHHRIHTGERPFSCPVCSRKFSQSSSVITHLRTHSGERPYRCASCSKTFSDSSTLTKHCRIHSGEKPYQCAHCALNFSQSGNLSRHLKLHGYINGVHPKDHTNLSANIINLNNNNINLNNNNTNGGIDDKSNVK